MRGEDEAKDEPKVLDMSGLGVGTPMSKEATAVRRGARLATVMLLSGGEKQRLLKSTYEDMS